MKFIVIIFPFFDDIVYNDSFPPFFLCSNRNCRSALTRHVLHGGQSEEGREAKMGWSVCKECTFEIRMTKAAP